MAKFSAPAAIIRQGARIVAQAADVVVPPPGGVVVLAYHQVGAPRRGPVNIEPGAFDEQMAMLASRDPAGCVVDLDHALAKLARSDDDDADRAKASAEDLVVLTFDDGTADFVDQALPILERYHLPVTLYLTTSFVEEGRSFWDDGTVLSGGALRDACATGLVTIGSHTHTHALFDRSPADLVELEVDQSIELIGERLGLAARHFAYPKALAPSPSADRVVRNRFASAALAGGHANRTGATDPWRLARTPIVAADRLSDVERKASGGLRLEGWLRGQFDRRRYGKAAR